MALPRYRPIALGATSPSPSDVPDWRTTFEQLMRAHYAKLCGFALRRVGSAAIAEDIVQDAFAAVWTRGASRAPEDPVAFLYRTVRNRAINHHRHERVRRRDATRVLDSVPQMAACTDDQVAQRELERAVVHAVGALPERCREVYRMSRELEMSYVEIAAALGISTKTVESHMGRALKALRIAVAPHLAQTLVFAAVAGVSRLFG